MMADGQEIEKRAWKFLFGIRRSVRYHNCRRVHFDRLSNLSSLISILFGSASIASLLATGGKLVPLVASVIVTISSALNLVVGPTRRARDHSDLAKRFVTLEKEIVGVSVPTNEHLRQWMQQRLEIEKDEPPVLKVLDSVCHNDQLRALGYGPEHFVEISPVQRLLAQFKDLSDHKIMKKQVPPKG
jgi:hypothetical protein